MSNKSLEPVQGWLTWDVQSAFLEKQGGLHVLPKLFY